MNVNLKIIAEESKNEILHCSDIHLGKRPFGTKEFSQKRYLDFFNAFEQSADRGIEKKSRCFSNNWRFV